LSKTLLCQASTKTSDSAKLLRSEADPAFHRGRENNMTLRKSPWAQLRTALSVVLALFVAAGMARAAVELGANAKVVARAYGELPDESRITVEIPNDSDVNLWVRDNVVLNLQQRGYQIVDDASLVLKIRSELRSDHDSGSRFSLGADSGISRENTLLLGYTVPLGERPSQGSQTYISITASLGERGKAPIWQGTASALARHRRALELQPVLVTLLIDAIGKTVGVSDY
jgi:hypothetical protein